MHIYFSLLGDSNCAATERKIQIQLWLESICAQHALLRGEAGAMLPWSRVQILEPIWVDLVLF